MFDTWRFHAFFTTTDPEVADTVAADKTHRGHAIIEQIHADLKASALAHMPSGVFTANAAWLVLAVIGVVNGVLRVATYGKAMSDLVEIEVPRLVQLYAPVVTSENVDQFIDSAFES